MKGIRDPRARQGVPAVAAALLRVAGRRWPAELRTSMLREWHAEVAVIGADPSQHPVVRAVRQLRFAISLACAAPVEDEYGVPRGWREFLPGLGRALQPVLMLLGAALLCGVLAGVLPTLGARLLLLTRGYPPGYRPGDSPTDADWAANTLALAALAVAALTAGWLGAWLGRRLPVDWAHRTRLGVAGSAMLAPIVMAGGTLAMDAAWQAQAPGPQEGVTVLTSEPMLPVLLWVALVAPLAAIVARYVHRGQRWRAALLAVAGGLIVLEVAAIGAGRHAAVSENVDFGTAGWWFPLTLLDLDASGVSFGRVEQGYVASETVVMIVANTLRPLLAATAFVLCYGMTAARSAVPAPLRTDLAEPAHQLVTTGPVAATAGPVTATAGPVTTTAGASAASTTDPEHAVAVQSGRLPDRTTPTSDPRDFATPTGDLDAATPAGDARPGVRLRGFGVAVAAIGLGLWTYVLTILTPGLSEVAAVDEVQSWELHLQAQELREGAIVLAVLGLLVTAAGRGPVLVPGLLGTALLLTVDSAYDAADLTGPVTVTGTFGVGAAILALGWWLSGILAGRGVRSSGAGQGGRTDVGGQWWVPEPNVRRRLGWVSAMAAFCAPALLIRAGWPGELTPAGYPTGTAIAAGMFTVVAMVTALAVRRNRLPVAVAAPLVGMPALLTATLGGLSAGVTGQIAYGVLLGPVLVAVVLAIMTMRRGPRAVVRWFAVGCGALLLGLPLMYAQLMLASLVGGPLMQAAGYGRPVDGLPFLPGTVLVAIPIAVAVATRIAPRAGTRTVPASVPNPRDHPVGPAVTSGRRP